MGNSMFLMPKFVSSLKSCVSAESTRYALGGIQLTQLDENHARAEATNAKILCRMEWYHQNAFEYPPVPGFSPGANGAVSAIVPVKALDSACKAIPKGSVVSHRPIFGNAAVTISEDSAVFATTNGDSSNVSPTKLVDGRWPKTEEVIPDHSNAVTKILLDPRELIKLLEPFVATADDNSAAVELTIKDRYSCAKLTRKNSTADIVGVIMPLVNESPSEKLIEKRRVYSALYLELASVADQLVDLLHRDQVNDDTVNHLAEIDRVNATKDWLANNGSKE